MIFLNFKCKDVLREWVQYIYIPAMWFIKKNKIIKGLAWWNFVEQHYDGNNNAINLWMVVNADGNVELTFSAFGSKSDGVCWLWFCGLVFADLSKFVGFFVEFYTIAFQNSLVYSLQFQCNSLFFLKLINWLVINNQIL